MVTIIRNLTIPAALILCFGCKTKTSEQDFLRASSDELSRIKSASYYTVSSASAPGDTMKFSEPRTQYVKIFANPGDTVVGVSSMLFPYDDTTRMTDFYDGIVRGTVSWDKKSIMVDSFRNDPYPFRLVHYPFYPRINEILKYALTTEDSIRTDFQDYGDSVHFRLQVINQHVYFHLKPIVIRNEYIPEDEISQFDIWFNSSDKLPFRMRSKWHHTTLFEECYGVRLNTASEVRFISTDYFPEGFEVRQFKRNTTVEKPDLTGKVAPNWILCDADNQTVELNDLNYKVILIQFTGIGCGPCHMALPFLNDLVTEYRDKSFRFISIETWSRNSEGIKRYKTNNNLIYNMLLSTDQVTKDYVVNSVPVFFILDEHKKIIKVINGYAKGTTDKEIRSAVEKLL